MSELDKHAKAGIEAINDNRLNDAIEHLQQALALDDSRPDLNNALGMTYLRRGDAANGIPFLKKAVTLSEPYNEPEHQEMRQHFHLGLATAQQALDLIKDSIETLRQTVSLWPQSLEVRLQLAQLLTQTGELDEGIRRFQELKDDASIDPEYREMSKVVAGTVTTFLESNLDGEVFLRAHQESYKQYFDEVSAEQVAQGWYAEAARMKKGPDGQPQPIIAQGARPYAMERVDLVNPEDGNAASIYSEKEPMIVTVNGFEPLAQVPVVFPWPGRAFDVRVCSRCPWHWLDVFIQFAQEGSEEELVQRIDPTIGDWYLAGFNGDFGSSDSGRFHYITDPEVIGKRTVNYRIDLGRSQFDAIPNLLKRLEILHSKTPIDCVLFGQGKVLS
jgi:tetratricopeptide (TPR) repeat protein